MLQSIVPIRWGQPLFGRISQLVEILALRGFAPPNGRRLEFGHFVLDSEWPVCKNAGQWNRSEFRAARSQAMI